MVDANRWPGLMSNADSADLPPGAATVQENCYARRAGQLSPRAGIRNVQFDNMPSATLGSHDVLALSVLATPDVYWVVYQDMNGNVRVGKKPL